MSICTICHSSVIALHNAEELNNPQDLHIRLARCPNCDSVADPYVEIDNVVLFLDLILIKPPAYRHIVYNVLLPQQFNFQLFRLFILMTLFEVYVSWAYQEKSYFEQSSHTSMIISLVLNSPIQYIYFLSTILLQNLIICISLTGLTINWLNLNHLPINSINDLFIVLLSTLLISNIIKLFPIVMLIWPYDLPILHVTRLLVSIVHLFLLVEAIHIVLSNPKNYNINNNSSIDYYKIIAIVISSEILRNILTKLITVFTASLIWPVSMYDLINDDWEMFKFKLNTLYELVNYMLDDTVIN